MSKYRVTVKEVTEFTAIIEASSFTAALVAATEAKESRTAHYDIHGVATECRESHSVLAEEVDES